MRLKLNIVVIVILLIVLSSAIFVFSLDYFYERADIQALHLMFEFEDYVDLVKNNTPKLYDIVALSAMQGSSVLNEEMREDVYYKYQNTKTSIRDLRKVSDGVYIFSIDNENILRTRKFIMVFKNNLGHDENGFYLIEDMEFLGVFDLSL